MRCYNARNGAGTIEIYLCRDNAETKELFNINATATADLLKGRVVFAANNMLATILIEEKTDGERS